VEAEFVDGEVELEQKKGGCRYDAGLRAKWDTIRYHFTQHNRSDRTDPEGRLCHFAHSPAHQRQAAAPSYGQAHFKPADYCSLLPRFKLFIHSLSTHPIRAEPAESTFSLDGQLAWPTR